jgi:hypothetical protein
MTRNRVEEFIATIANLIRVISSNVKNDIAYRWGTEQDTVEVMGCSESLIEDDPNRRKVISNDSALKL